MGGGTGRRSRKKVEGELQRSRKKYKNKEEEIESERGGRRGGVGSIGQKEAAMETEKAKCAEGS